MAGFTTPPTNRVREYETIFILNASIDADKAEGVANRVAEVIAREGGKLLKVENWGRRRLAYEINKQKRGVYTYLKYLGGGALVKELERNLRLQESVIRHQTVLLRTDVLAEEITIDPEETKFARLEAPADDEKDDSRERQLGFLDAPEDRRDRRRDGDEVDELEAFEEETMNPDLAADAEEKLNEPAQRRSAR
jgi:small subunit ribosomal protein S6